MQTGPDRCLISPLVGPTSRMGYVCISSLLLNVGFGNFLSSQAQSLSPAPNVSESSAESAVGMAAKKHFALYVAKDRDGRASQWSTQSSGHATTRQASEKQFVAEDVKISHLVSRPRIKRERASQALDVELTLAGQQSRLPQRQVHSFSLNREGGVWNAWQRVSSYDELASALDDMASVEECAKRLAQEKNLVDSELVKALNRLAE